MYDPYNPYEDKSPKLEVNFKRNRISAKKSGVGTVNAGGAIIIIIFVVLCLVIFGLLSFATSFADKKLADKNLANVSQYYSADTAAEEKLAMICDAVSSKLGGGLALDEIVRSAAEEMPFEIDMAERSADENTEMAAVRYRTEMDTDASGEAKVNSYLDSGVSFYYDKNTGKLTYKIYEWKVVVESEFDYDEKQIDVWNGDFDF